LRKEHVVYCDQQGKPTGEVALKLAAHTDATRMHLAFSCYIFNAEGKILATQRAAQKKVWPTVWTNSVCGHLLPEETIEDAVRRRARYELGMDISHLKVILPEYHYKTPPYRGIIEHEFCPVYFAVSASEVYPNSDEVGDFRWMGWSEYIGALQADDKDVWSWWCKNQLVQLLSEPLTEEYRSGIGSSRTKSYPPLSN
jgi:isopentenyl-diphosphate Delta-isomerase